MFRTADKIHMVLSLAKCKHLSNFKPFKCNEKENLSEFNSVLTPSEMVFCAHTQIMYIKSPLKQRMGTKLSSLFAFYLSLTLLLNQPLKLLFNLHLCTIVFNCAIVSHFVLILLMTVYLS